MPEWLPQHFVLPCGSVATRKRSEPWFYTVVQAKGADFSEIEAIPGVAYDAFNKQWIVPEEIISMFMLEAK